MKDLEPEREVIRQYLLGELNEKRQQTVEERYMTDRNYRDEVLIVESELVEDYLTETLLPDERGKFEKHYLSAPRQQKNLKLTRMLIKATQFAKPLPIAKTNWLDSLRNFFQPSNPRVRFATASLILLALLGGGIILYAWRLSVQKAELQEELAQLNTPQSILGSDSSVPSVTLLPVIMRDKGALPRITITSAIKVVQLRVPVETNTYGNYRVELRTIEGEQIVEFEVKRQPIEALIVQVPARILEPNDYLLTLSGLNAQGLSENLGEYSFRVVQQ